MKTKLLSILLIKRNLSINLKPFIQKRTTNKTFWYFHKSINFKEITFRNEKSDQNSSNESNLRKQLSDSIIKNANNIISDIVCTELSLKTKLYILDTLSVIHGTEHKTTINFFDSLRPQIIFEIHKQNIFVLMHLLYLSSVIKTENKDDFGFLVTKITEKVEHHFLKESTTDRELFSTDISVLCHSLFRLKAKFKTNTVLKLFSNMVCEDIKTNRLNKSHVLSIVKYMRFNRFIDEKLIECIKTFVESNSNRFSFTECTHYLAFFANLSLYEQNIYHLLVERIERLLESSSLETKLRSKDLSRFLWCVCVVNHKLSQNLIDSVLKNIEILMSTDFNTYPHFLIDCFKSLIILGIYPQKLLSQSLNSKLWLKLVSNSERNKIPTDLYFILESIAIERPDIPLERRTLAYSLSKENEYSLNKQCRQRPKLLKYFSLINQNANNAKPIGQLSYCLQHIPIASIIINEVSLEVVDQSITVANDSNHLNGLMSAKIRQMSAKSIPYLLIHNKNDLKQYLQSI